MRAVAGAVAPTILPFACRERAPPMPPKWIARRCDRRRGASMVIYDISISYITLLEILSMVRRDVAETILIGTCDRTLRALRHDDDGCLAFGQIPNFLQVLIRQRDASIGPIARPIVRGRLRRLIGFTVDKNVPARMQV